MRITKGVYDVWVIKGDKDNLDERSRAELKLKKAGFKHNQITFDQEYGYWILTAKRKLSVRRNSRCF